MYLVSINTSNKSHFGEVGELLMPNFEYRSLFALGNAPGRQYAFETPQCIEIDTAFYMESF